MHEISIQFNDTDIVVTFVNKARTVKAVKVKMNPNPRILISNFLLVENKKIKLRIG
jgi:hypothetical protein